MNYPPNIKLILDKYVTDLNIRRLSTSAINGYGVSISYIISLFIRDSKCSLCHTWATKMPIMEQMLPQNRACHKWLIDWNKLDSIESPSYEEAIEQLNNSNKIKAYLA
jgi:hypothetical protein